MSTPTKLGIITNYKDDILSGENIKNPTEIELERWFGITDTSSEFIQENLKGGEDIILFGGQTKEQFLQSYFKGKFETFNKLSIDSTPKKNLDSPWFNKFDETNLIVLYLEVNKNENNKWNTVKNSDGKNYNRIYLFDKDGKEVRTREDTKSAFYEIIIQNNDLTLTKDGVKVTFQLTGIAMTLAKLINKLLDTNITYNNKNVPAEERKLLPGESRTSDRQQSVNPANIPPPPPEDPRRNPTGDPTAPPVAQPFQSSTASSGLPRRAPTRAEEEPQGCGYSLMKTP